MKRIGRFFKRQWKTKTGKGAITGIVGTGIGMATGTVPILIGIAGIWGGLEAMFLRDEKAKEKERSEAEKP